MKNTRELITDIRHMASPEDLMDETQRLLKIAQRQPLYPRNKRDAAVIYAVTHKMKLEEFDTFMDSLENEYE